MHARDKNVFIAVVVVVADRDAHVVAGAREPGLFGYVGEVAVAVVLEEAVGIFRGSLLERLDVRSVGEENVELAVVVVIEDRDAARHSFWRVAFGRLTAVELEINWLEGEVDRAVGSRLSRRGGRLRR